MGLLMYAVCLIICYFFGRFVVYGDLAIGLVLICVWSLIWLMVVFMFEIILVCCLCCLDLLAMIN